MVFFGLLVGELPSASLIRMVRWLAAMDTGHKKDVV